MTLLNSKELFERVRRALKNMGAENHDIESYISNLEDVLLGEESTNKSLKATFNSLSDKAKSELSLAMNTTEPVVSDTAVGELVKAIQDPKQVERVAASIEHAASNAPATLESVVARAEKRLPGLTAANRQVLIDEIKATEIPGTGKYKYTNKNLADFEEAYLRKTSRERLKQVARDAKTVGAPQVIEATKPSATELHIQAVTAKNPEMGAFLREAANKADLAGAPVELDALKRLQRIAAGGKGLTLKEQGEPRNPQPPARTSMCCRRELHSRSSREQVLSSHDSQYHKSRPSLGLYPTRDLLRSRTTSRKPASTIH